MRFVIIFYNVKRCNSVKKKNQIIVFKVRTISEQLIGNVYGREQFLPN